jgi:hypothetical protein
VKYITVEELYLTFLTHNDSYMKKVPVGTILEVIDNDIYFEDICSIDHPLFLIENGFIEEYDPI